MAHDIQDITNQIKLQGWRQGRLIISANAEHIKAVSIDYFNHTVTPDTWLVVLTQDCDLVRDIAQEPHVELLAVKKLPKKPDNAMRGQSARLLHLTINVNQVIQWFECNINDRFRIKKASLLGLGCDMTIALEENELRLLRQWLARRYTRAAFPDHFETHLASTKGQVKSLFKSQAAKLISTVYIAIDNEEADSEEDYVIHVRLTALAEDLADEDKRESIDDFENRFIEVFNKRPHIKFALKYPSDPESYDVQVLSEEDVTLRILRQYKRFDADYRSSDDDASPPEGIEVN